MNNKSTSQRLKFRFLRGEKAYVLFFAEYAYSASLENLKIFYQNLELIIGDEGIIYAYRSDYPYDMRGMVKDDGKWIITDEGEALNLYDAKNLKLLCLDYIYN